VIRTPQHQVRPPLVLVQQRMLKANQTTVQLGQCIINNCINNKLQPLDNLVLTQLKVWRRVFPENAVKTKPATTTEQHSNNN
jgi:hypothetical protein